MGVQITLGIFGILSFRFLTICFRKDQIHHCTLLRNKNNNNYMENELS